MKDAFFLLRNYPSIGNFLAYQFATDINYSTISDFSEMEFVVPGPGAISGIRKCFSDTGGWSDADVIRFMSDRQEQEFERLGLTFATLCGRPLQLVDCQNLFCEVDKYARVTHPEVAAISGRTRIKQRFRPRPDTIEFWYPPKWGINDGPRVVLRGVSTQVVATAMLREMAMDFRTYQQAASETDRNPGPDEAARMIPLAGLVSETGELLAEYKKYLRDGRSHQLFKARLAEELGDLLWYTANAATKFDLDLSQIAEHNLTKCKDRWSPPPPRTPFDEGYPNNERLPRQFTIEFRTLSSPARRERIRVTHNGARFGDELDDNAHQSDGYGYHDVLHLAFAAVLGWSPLVRKMMSAKRKSQPHVDRIEDGGRAIAIEEGIAAMIFAYARDYNFLEGKSSVSSELLRLIKNMVSHLEVSVCTAGEWERAIIEGFRVWREVRRTRGGLIDLDLDRRTIALRCDGSA